MQALKCDRCKKYYDTEENQDVYIRKRGYEAYDLCDDCYTELITWLNAFKPADDPSEPTTDPTEPATDPTEPSTEPTTDPAEGGDDNG